MVKRLALALLAGCGNDVVTINLVIDGPTSGSAAAFPDLDSVEISIALAGEPLNLTTKTFKKGEEIELPDVPYGENLVVHMIGRVGNSEVATGRTCPFAVRTSEDPPSPHLYFARTVKWAEFDSPTLVSGEPTFFAARDGATALTDFAGNGVYIGGVDQTALPLSGIDRFDTMQGRFELADPDNRKPGYADVEPRRNGGAAPLGDGRIVIAGGTESNGLASESLEIVNLQAASGRRVEQFNAAPSFVGISAPAMVATSDGHVVAFGGSDSIGNPQKQIIDIRAVGAGIEQRELQRAELAIPRKQHTATRLSDDLGAPILVIGGRTATGDPIARAELYKPLIEEMVPAAQFSPNMIVPRHDHEAVRLPDGSVLVIGGLRKGLMDELVPVRELEIFTFDSGFQMAGVLPPAAGVVDFTVTPLPDGSILLAGGRDMLNNPVRDSFIIRLDPNDGELDVVTTDRLTSQRARHQATLLCDGTVMLVGGTLIAAKAERYNPPSTGRR